MYQRCSFVQCQKVSDPTAVETLSMGSKGQGVLAPRPLPLGPAALELEATVLDAEVQEILWEGEGNGDELAVPKRRTGQFRLRRPRGGGIFAVPTAAIPDLDVGTEGDQVEEFFKRKK